MQMFRSKMISTLMSRDHEITKSLFFCRRSLPFGGSHLRLPSGPAGIRTATGNLSALARPTPYQLSHRVASRNHEITKSRNCTNITESRDHDCNDDCNNYKFISHQIGQYQPRIFARHVSLPGIWFRVPMSLALSLCRYILRPRRGLALASPSFGKASPSFEAPRLQTCINIIEGKELS